MNPSIIITGGNGFLGNFIVKAVKAKHPNWSITVFDLHTPKEPYPETSYEIGDITNTHQVNQLITKIKPTAIIHTAGIVPPLSGRYGRQDRDEVFRVNVGGTRNILDAARKGGVKAFVWTSSFTAVTDDMRVQYPNIDERWPTAGCALIYGKSKAAAEALVLAANDEKFATCALRPSVLFGPGDSQLIPSLHACIAKGETPFVIGDGLNLWDITYVTNAADAHVLALENLLSSRTAAGEAIFISNEQPVPFRDICLAVWRECGHFPPFEIHIPKTVAAIFGFLAEVVTYMTGTSTTLSRGSVLDACAIRYCNGEKARRLLGYKPRVGLEEGIRISCADFKRQLQQRELDLS